MNKTMVSKHFEEQFRRFCIDNNVKWNNKKKLWTKPFHPKIKNIWVQSNDGNFLNSMRPKERGYYESKFLGWELGAIKKEYCFWCGRIIEETRKNNPRSEKVKFCNSAHRKTFGKVKSDQEKIGKILATE
jgi:hypothetical protein